jgi:hypothetical protein
MDEIALSAGRKPEKNANTTPRGSHCSPCPNLTLYARSTTFRRTREEISDSHRPCEPLSGRVLEEGTRDEYSYWALSPCR